MKMIMMAPFGQVLSSMEKQFGIKSEEAAWIFSGIIIIINILSMIMIMIITIIMIYSIIIITQMSGNEISQIFFIFFFPLLAKIRRRSLWTSVAMLLSALGPDKPLVKMMMMMMMIMIIMMIMIMMIKMIIAVTQSS